jgi:hypothetical protein
VAGQAGRARLNLAAAGLTQAQWRERWDAARLFLTADGEKDKAWGNETIRWHPDQCWLEVKLPAPLACLGNRPHGRYRLDCQVRFGYRGDEVAAQAATGALRYDICFDPARDRWYRAAAPFPAPSRPCPCRALEDLPGDSAGPVKCRTRAEAWFLRAGQRDRTVQAGRPGSSLCTTMSE